MKKFDFYVQEGEPAIPSIKLSLVQKDGYVLFKVDHPDADVDLFSLQNDGQLILYNKALDFLGLKLIKVNSAINF